jgi:hypothetical protein
MLSRQDSLATLSRIELGAFGQIYVAVIPRLLGDCWASAYFPSWTAPRLPSRRLDEGVSGATLEVLIWTEGWDVARAHLKFNQI